MKRILSVLLGCAGLLVGFATPVSAQSTGCAALTMPTPGCLPAATAGQAYGFQATTVGGVPPIRYAVVSGSIPPGMTLSPSGFFSGVPSTTGTYPLTLQATDRCPGGAQRASKPISLTVNSPAAGMTVSPASFRVPRRASSNQGLVWGVRSAPGVNATLRSQRGWFLLSGEIVGESPAPLTLAVAGGVGRVQESLLVPVAVVLEAEQRGLTRLTYRRTFSDGPTVVTGVATVFLTTGAGADLKITRLQLSFDNGRAEVTVGPRHPGLKAYADIRFSGAGLLRGQWEVDGRIISQVNQQLVYGKSIRLATPDAPALPTFVAGTHRVRLVLTHPAGAFTPPEAIYYVTSGETAAGALPIALLAPAHLSRLPFGAPEFRWQGVSQATVYLLRLLPKQGDEPVAEAYLRTMEYPLPEALLQDRLAPGAVYRWQVTGFDADGREIARSPVYRFSFDELPWTVPGRLLVCTRADAAGVAVAESLASRYELTRIDSFELDTLPYRVTVFDTDRDVALLVAELAAETGVLLVQPEQLFRTRGDLGGGGETESQDLRLALGMTAELPRQRGAGVTVAVVDTGVDASHPELVDRVVAQENLVADSEYVAEIHGTAVAGVIAASRDAAGIAGVAPEADILALRACRQVVENRPGGECASSAVARAIDRAVQLDARVVNMSYGAPLPDPLLARLLDAGAKRGVWFVAPVGNRPDQAVPEFPAAHPAVIGVAGTDERGKPFPNAELAAWAQVVAPARNLFTTVPGGRYNFISGTSLAAAQVSGVLAMAVEKSGTSVELSEETGAGVELCRWVGQWWGSLVCGQER